MSTTIATITLDRETSTLIPAPFTSSSDGFLLVTNDTPDHQTITADCYAGASLEFSYSGEFVGNTEFLHSLHVPINTTITMVVVTVVGAANSPLTVDLTNKNLMSTISIDVNGAAQGPDSTLNVTSTLDPLSVNNESTTTYYAFVGTHTTATALPPGTTSVDASQWDYLTISSSSTSPERGTVINIRHVDKSVVVINVENDTQTFHPAIIAPSDDGHFYLVNLSTKLATVTAVGYVGARWTKTPVVISGGGVFRYSLSQFDDPANPPNPPPLNYQVSLNFDISGDPTIAIKRPVPPGS